MEDQYLFQTLFLTCSSPSSTSSTNDIKFFSSNSGIFFRLLSITFIAIISLWANYEASKGFEITIINEVKDSPVGQRFTLFYISNDKATRIVQNTSTFVENILYSNTNHTKKQVNHVTLQLTSKNVSNIVMTVVDTIKKNEYVIYISPSIMEDTNINVDYAIISSVQRAMARIWLWDGESRAPPRLLDGIIEYISMLAGFGHQRNFGGGKLPIFGHTCWDDKDPRVVAQFPTAESSVERSVG